MRYMRALCLHLQIILSPVEGSQCLQCKSVILSVVMQAKEPVLASFLHQNIISHSSLGKAMAVLLANKLSSRTLLGTQLMQLISEAYRDDPVRLSM